MRNMQFFERGRVKRMKNLVCLLSPESFYICGINQLFIFSNDGSTNYDTQLTSLQCSDISNAHLRSIASLIPRGDAEDEGCISNESWHRELCHIALFADAAVH